MRHVTIIVVLAIVGGAPAQEERPSPNVVDDAALKLRVVLPPDIGRPERQVLPVDAARPELGEFVRYRAVQPKRVVVHVAVIPEPKANPEKNPFLFLLGTHQGLVRRQGGIVLDHVFTWHRGHPAITWVSKRAVGENSIQYVHMRLVLTRGEMTMAEVVTPQPVDPYASSVFASLERPGVTPVETWEVETDHFRVRVPAGLVPARTADVLTLRRPDGSLGAALAFEERDARNGASEDGTDDAHRALGDFALELARQVAARGTLKLVAGPRLVDEGGVEALWEHESGRGVRWLRYVPAPGGRIVATAHFPHATGEVPAKTKRTDPPAALSLVFSSLETVKR